MSEAVGCLDASACNYDASANTAGYCDYPETGYDCEGECLNDSDNDGVCNEFEVAGCTDVNACNYAAAATDGMAVAYATGYACDGGCLLDSGSDGVCDQNEVAAAKTPRRAITTPLRQMRDTVITLR